MGLLGREIDRMTCAEKRDAAEEAAWGGARRACAIWGAGGRAMRPVAPRTGAPEITLAEDQPQYAPITVAVYRRPPTTILMRWRPNADDLARLASGEDLYIALLTYGQPMQPIRVQVGPEGWQEDGHG